MWSPRRRAPPALPVSRSPRLPGSVLFRLHMHSRGEHVLAGSARALVLAEPRAGATVAIRAETNQMDCSFAPDLAIPALSIPGGENAYRARMKELPRIAQPWLQPFDRGQVE